MAKLLVRQSTLIQVTLGLSGGFNSFRMAIVEKVCINNYPSNRGRVMSKPTVLLEGDSLLMDSIAALLQSDGRLEVRRIGKASDRLPLWALEPPAIVLFDLDRIEAGLLLNYLTENPGPALIGLSLTGNKVLLLSRELRTVATHEELQAIIMNQLRKEK